jgi:hypothetical protein
LWTRSSEGRRGAWDEWLTLCVECSSSAIFPEARCVVRAVGVDGAVKVRRGEACSCILAVFFWSRSSERRHPLQSRTDGPQRHALAVFVCSDGAISTRDDWLREGRPKSTSEAVILVASVHVCHSCVHIRTQRRLGLLQIILYEITVAPASHTLQYHLSLKDKLTPYASRRHLPRCSRAHTRPTQLTKGQQQRPRMAYNRRLRTDMGLGLHELRGSARAFPDFAS